MDNEIKIGIASTDGKIVNQHFGRAEAFYIVKYQRDTKLSECVELRKVVPVCHGGEHEQADLNRNIEKLKDLDCLLVSKVGARAELALENNGIIVYELPGFIEESIEQLSKHLEIQEMMGSFF